MDLKALFKRKSVQISFLIFSIALGTWSIFGMVDLFHAERARDVERELMAAEAEREKSPPGLQRAEVFLQRLKAINLNVAPAELKQALHDYVSAMEQGLVAAKAGRDTKDYDAKMASAKEALFTCLKKYD